MHYGRETYWRRKRANPRPDLSFKNKRLMSSYDKATLEALRVKYGADFKKPSLKTFHLNGTVMDAIRRSNEDVNMKNEQAKVQATYVNEKKAKMLNAIFVLLCLTAIVSVSIIGSAIGVSSEIIVLVDIYVLPTLAISMCTAVKKHYVVKPRLIPSHPRSADLQAYDEAVEDYAAFHRLVLGEKIDQRERSRKQFWISLNGFEFEAEMAKLFGHLGYNATKTKDTGDGGVDIILFDRDGVKTVVQCKAHKKEVGPHVVRDLFGVMHATGARKGILVNLGGFTQGVRDFIVGKPITLMDLNNVLDLVDKV